MIFWVDAQLPPGLAVWLRETQGVDAKALREIGLRDAGDLEIAAVPGRPVRLEFTLFSGDSAQVGDGRGVASGFQIRIHGTPAAVRAKFADPAVGRVLGAAAHPVLQRGDELVPCVAEGAVPEVAAQLRVLDEAAERHPAVGVYVEIAPVVDAAGEQAVVGLPPRLRGARGADVIPRLRGGGIRRVQGDHLFGGEALSGNLGVALRGAVA